VRISAVKWMSWSAAVLVIAFGKRMRSPLMPRDYQWRARQSGRGGPAAVGSVRRIPISSANCTSARNDPATALAVILYCLRGAPDPDQFDVGQRLALLLSVVQALMPGPARRAQARHRIELRQTCSTVHSQNVREYFRKSAPRRACRPWSARRSR